MKTCTYCNKSEPEVYFYETKGGTQCAQCILKKQRAYRIYSKPGWRDRLLRNWKRAG